MSNTPPRPARTFTAPKTTTHHFEENSRTRPSERTFAWDLSVHLSLLRLCVLLQHHRADLRVRKPTPDQELLGVAMEGACLPPSEVPLVRVRRRVLSPAPPAPLKGTSRKLDARSDSCHQTERHKSET